MFGPYNIPFRAERENILVETIIDADSTSYQRKLDEDTVDKKILSTNKKIIISPIKPINQPKKLTPNLMIEFDTTLFLEPRSTRKIYLKFPIEIGVFIVGGKSFELLDVFSVLKQKYTLYGDPINGVICKYWKSSVEVVPPETHLLHEGVMELSVTNKSSSWLEVKKAVFNCYGMKIYYNEKYVIFLG